MTGALEVVRPGVRCLVQDLGRPGHAAIGVSPSGAADRASLVAANRAVGNADGAAALEIVLGGTVLVARQELTVCPAGAPAPLLLDGAPVERGAAVAVPPGSRLQVRSATTGLRCYLAVRGGVLAPTVLGSASTDTLSGLGPPPVAAGDVLEIGDAVGGPGVAIEGWQAPGVLDLVPGPRDDWFTGLDGLTGGAWTVLPASDRVGVRLTGTPLQRVDARRDAELPSEGVVRGSVQVPPDGLPILMGPDHPVTGGYPVIGVLTERSADASAQLRPGATVRFRIAATTPG